MRGFFIWFCWFLSDHTEWWPWLSSWLSTWSILLDKEMMARIRETREALKTGEWKHWATLEEVMGEAGITKEELDAMSDVKILPDNRKVKP